MNTSQWTGTAFCVTVIQWAYFSYARKVIVRSTACISCWVCVESGAAVWFTPQDHSQEKIQEYLSLFTKLVWSRQMVVNSLSTWLKLWRAFLLFYLVYRMISVQIILWVQGWCWFEKKPLSTTNVPPSPLQFLLMLFWSLWLGSFHIFQN